MSGKILLSQKKIATLSGISQQMVSYILSGDRQPSVQMAEKLEAGTGVCREAWLWPDRHFNPYIPFTDAKVCDTCRNRKTRLAMSLNLAERIFKETRSFDSMSEIHRLYDNIKHDEIIYRYREVKDDAMYLLNTPRELDVLNPTVISKEILGKVWDGLMKNGHLYLASFPPELAGYEYLKQMAFRSGLIVVGPKQRLSFAIANYVGDMLFTDEMIKEVRLHVAKVEEFWLANQN